MLLELLEFGACSVVESPVFFGFRVKFHIEGDKRVDSAFFDLFARTPESECTYKLAELRTPISEMVYSDAVIPRKLMYELKGMTDNGRSEMSYMERLRNVRRCVIEDNGLAFADLVLSIAFARVDRVFQHVQDEIFSGNLEIQIPSINRNAVESGDSLRCFSKSGSNFRGCLTQRFAEFEARKRNIAESIVRRILKHRCDLVLSGGVFRKSFCRRFGERRGKFFLKFKHRFCPYPLISESVS